MPVNISITRIEGKVKAILSICLKISRYATAPRSEDSYRRPPICTLERR